MRIKEVIVVEGYHDKQAIDRAVTADCLISGGSAVSESFLLQVERAMKERGVIIFTDPDYAGERIRKIVARRVPGCKHAFLPREEARADDGDIGIENASPESIRMALSAVRTEWTGNHHEISWDDMIQLGLTGGPDSASKRDLLGRKLQIGYGNAKTFWKRLNMLGVTRRELIAAYEDLEQGSS
ncbi:ribonuclease M5 [Collibacillus ludicampi]|uniref:Ribonuclease M5 n=1 Tax=Collibacillus ludicampi TaxID=2771369 RepID=A0AAV4LE16_9BACL|nr:ribonuclease M5 [Collibacillus ludicampi]GIM46021.1 ribonuclease M5 [Collibacillus ludicampi]